MRTVQLIQFTGLSHKDFGHILETNLIYQVNDMNEVYYNEWYDDENDEYHEDEYRAIEIIRSIQVRPNGNVVRRHGKVINDDNTTFNLLTIELDDESQLFR